jgi:hypothetical protein
VVANQMGLEKHLGGQNPLNQTVVKVMAQRPPLLFLDIDQASKKRSASLSGVMSMTVPM